MNGNGRYVGGIVLGIANLIVTGILLAMGWHLGSKIVRKIGGKRVR